MMNVEGCDRWCEATGSYANMILFLIMMSTPLTNRGLAEAENTGIIHDEGCDVGLENLSLSRRPSLTEASWKRWERTLERTVPAIVALRFNVVRSFDTEKTGSSQASGFIVDAERGIILTNRHVINPGPITAEAIFHDHEELTIRAIYRDPVHDFGFAQFDPKKLKYMKCVDIPLRPDLARIGVEIRVVGNDAGEKLSILAGTLARLDRPAPFYGTGKYTDFDTFYYQAASSTSGGSSGSPVIDINGNAIALNAGGKRKAASSYYLPLDRVERALRLFQQQKPITRGTLQAVFKHQPYDEVRRLGLQPETEALFRTTFPDQVGMLVVEEVLPHGPAFGYLEAGDLLVAVNKENIVRFIDLEEILDTHVGVEVELLIERGGRRDTFKMRVQDLHAITPNRYVEFGGGIAHQLSYQMAKAHSIATAGVFIAATGYIFGTANITRGAIVLSVNNIPTETLDNFIQIMSNLPDGSRVPVRYNHLNDPYRHRIAIIHVDHRWFRMSMAMRDDQLGIWNIQDIPICPDKQQLLPATASLLTVDDTLEGINKVIASLVSVEFYIPYQIDGVSTTHYGGVGVIMDKERGLVVVDRNTVPISIGDIQLVFGGSTIIPGRLCYLHPYQNFAIIHYDPQLLGNTPVKSAIISDHHLQQGDSVTMVALTSTYQPVFRETVVTRIRELGFREPMPPRFRAINMEGIEVTNPFANIAGVLCDKRGHIQAFWWSFSFQNVQDEDHELWTGVDARVVLPALESIRLGKASVLRALNAEMSQMALAEARSLGLSQSWVTKIEAAELRHRFAFYVRRIFATLSGTLLLKEGDILLEMNGVLLTKFKDLEVNDKETVNLHILREGKEMDIETSTALLTGDGTQRFVIWCGALLQAPHTAVWMQRKDMPKGIYSSFWFNGSPAHMYGLRATVWITEVNGHAVPDLDTFLVVVNDLPSETFVRIKIVDFSNRWNVIALKTDYHYWPTSEMKMVRRDPLGWDWEYCSHKKMQS